MAKFDNCPNCNLNLIDKPIPQEYHEYHYPPYFYRKEIGIYDRDKDSTVAYRCPNCKFEWKV